MEQIVVFKLDLVLLSSNQNRSFVHNSGAMWANKKNGFLPIQPQTPNIANVINARNSQYLSVFVFLVLFVARNHWKLCSECVTAICPAWEFLSIELEKNASYSMALAQGIFFCSEQCGGLSHSRWESTNIFHFTREISCCVQGKLSSFGSCCLISPMPSICICLLSMCLWECCLH